jgi:hypothetical protein
MAVRNESKDGVTKSNPRTKCVFVKKGMTKLQIFFLLMDHVRGMLRVSIHVGE